MRDNYEMSERTRRNMSERLSHLMRNTPSLDTLEKVAAKSGVSYGTVRRIKNNDPTDVQIGNVEAIAECFGITLIEFVADFDAKEELTPAERQAIRNLRSIGLEYALDTFKQIAKVAALTKAAGRLTQWPDDLAHSG